MFVDLRINETPRGYVVTMEHLAGPSGKRFVVAHDVWGPSERKPSMSELLMIQNIWDVAQRIIQSCDGNPCLDPKPANQYLRGQDIDETQTARGRAEHHFIAGAFGVRI